MEDPSTPYLLQPIENFEGQEFWFVKNRPLPKIWSKNFFNQKNSKGNRFHQFSMVALIRQTLNLPDFEFKGNLTSHSIRRTGYFKNILTILILYYIY